MGAAAALGVVVMLFQSCGGSDEPEVPHPTALGYPGAPEQQLPRSAGEDEAAEEGAPGEDDPVAELPAESWVVDAAERTGIPQRAVYAYAGAALDTAETRPDCGIGWNTLAGIGQVESVHGQFEGSTISADGDVSPPITGVALDGSEGVLEIPDTDDGELDGDEEWDRAAGPMQFIPQTWQRYAADGNMDGEADVHNIDDAALSAASYLCKEGGDLTSDRGWNSAVGTYNQSVPYANDVADHAEEYLPE